MHRLTLKNFMDKEKLNWFSSKAISLFEYLIGLKKLDGLYQTHQCEGLSAEQFTRKFIDIFELKLEIKGLDLTHIDKGKPCVIVANHPFGGVEGVLLAHVLAQYHPNLKILANRALSIFPELAPYFIFTNPLKPGATGNAESLRACKQHLVNNGLLVIFPAGRVSYFRPELQQISDHEWHRSLMLFVKTKNIQILPLFIQGKNRSRFYAMGRIYFRFRLLMLIREMIASKGKTIPMHFSQKIITNNLPECPKLKSQSQFQTDLIRLTTYLQDPSLQQNSEFSATEKATATDKMQPLANPIDKSRLAAEIKTLPNKQKLSQHKNTAVYYAYFEQIPYMIEEIRRARELTFRLLDEGSGKPKDGDALDKTYTHLFIFDHDANQLVGAYRMGQTDILQQQQGQQEQQGLYLTQMFHFKPDFINQQQPCLEMGRSFVLPEYQKKFYPLLLLFRGISQFCYLNPQYQTLYGTVSLSNQYTPLSIYLIEQFLVDNHNEVEAKQAFNHKQSRELNAFLNRYPSVKTNLETLEWLIKQIEPDGKGVPVLLKQYFQLKARFHCLGIDPNFAQTPGLLLSVHLPSAPMKQLKLFLGDNYDTYLERTKSCSILK